MGWKATFNFGISPTLPKNKIKTKKIFQGNNELEMILVENSKQYTRVQLRHNKNVNI